MLDALHFLSRLAAAGRLGFVGACIASAGLASTLTVNLLEGDRKVLAQFDAAGGQLTITLTNQAALPAYDNSDIICGVFFNVAGNLQLTPGSVILGPLSDVANGGMAVDIGKNWAYGWNIVGPQSATQGISSAGFGLFNKGKFCSGANCGNKLQGSDWGLVGKAYTDGSGNASINDVPMIRNSAVYILSGLPQDFDPSTGISDVSAQYTASLTGPNLWQNGSEHAAATPEPGSLALIGVGLIVLGTVRRRKRC